MEGFEVVRAVEADPFAAETYRLNIGDHVHVDDVRNVSPSGRCEVLIAGPPCQGFSTLGKCLANDPRNRLSLEVVQWARVTRPQVVVIENVVPFLGSSVWKRLNRDLSELGFRVHAFSLNALDFGVPQDRQRSFTIATRRCYSEPAPPGQQSRVTVRQAWRGLPDLPNQERQHIAPKPSRLALARMRVIPPGGDKRDVMKRAKRLTPPSWWRMQCAVTDVWGRMLWDCPANTIRTSFQNPSKGRYIHPEQDRVITLREGARLQSIPDSWSFEGPPTRIARQIGNGVPIVLGRAIATSVRRAIA